jgi:hypothetical protein
MQLCLKETTSKLTSKEAQKYVDNSSDIALEDIEWEFELWKKHRLLISLGKIYYRVLENFLH